MKKAFCLSLLALVIASCAQSQRPLEKGEEAPALLALFADVTSLPDTLYIPLEEDTSEARKLIPDSLLLAELDSATP